eukprot:Selendium_serpulae@DN4177_c0_g1_i1.p1
MAAWDGGDGIRIDHGTDGKDQGANTAWQFLREWRHDPVFVVPVDKWKIVTQRLLLNVNTNHGLTFPDTTELLQAQDYARAAKNFGSLSDFSRYSVRIWKSELQSNYRVQFFDQKERRYQDIKIDEEAYVTEDDDVRYRIRAASKTDTAVLEIFATEIDDDYGGSPIVISTMHKSQRVFLFIETDTDGDGWGTASFRVTPSKGVNANYYFYLAQKIEQPNKDVAFAEFDPKDTYYPFYQHTKNVMAPFGYADRIAMTDSWGPSNRFGYVETSGQRIRLNNTSQHAKFQMRLRGLSDTQGMSDDGYYKLGRGSPLDFELLPQERDGAWAVIRNLNYHGNFRARNDGVHTHHGTDNRDQDSDTAWQFLRVRGNSAELIGAAPPYFNIEFSDYVHVGDAPILNVALNLAMNYDLAQWQELKAVDFVAQAKSFDSLKGFDRYNAKFYHSKLRQAFKIKLYNQADDDFRWMKVDSEYIWVGYDSGYKILTAMDEIWIVIGVTISLLALLNIRLTRSTTFQSSQDLY